MPEALDRAFLLFNQSRLDLAEREVRRALADSPDDPMAHALLSFCRSAAKDNDGATTEAIQAVAHGPALPFARYALANAHFRADRPAEALDAIDAAIGLDPTDADAHTLRAAILIDRRRWADALAAADYALMLSPEHQNAANFRALALVKLGRKDEAGETIRGALQQEPENAMSHANLGWTLLHRSDYKQALVHFREALRIDADLDWARVGMVEALKARYLPYRLLLRFFLWMSTLSGRARWVILGAIFFGPRILEEVGASNPWAVPILRPLSLLIVGFAVLTWVADPLFNLLLRVNKFGRYALSRDQTVASNWVLGMLLGAVIAPSAILAVFGRAAPRAATELAVIAFAYFALLILPISATFRVRRGWERVVMGTYTAGLAVIGLYPFAMLFGIVARQPGSINMFLFGLIGSTWLAALLARGR